MHARTQTKHPRVFVCFSILVPRSHMTITPPCLICLGLFLNIPCSEVQRVVYRDFPFLRVLLCLSLTHQCVCFLYLALHASFWDFNQNLWKDCMLFICVTELASPSCTAKGKKKKTVFFHLRVFDTAYGFKLFFMPINLQSSYLFVLFMLINSFCRNACKWEYTPGKVKGFSLAILSLP